MTKWILLFSAGLQIIFSVAFAERAVTSENFNTLIDAVNADQKETASQMWNSKRIQDYIRRKRTLQNVKSMIAEVDLQSENKNSEEPLALRNFSDN